MADELTPLAAVLREAWTYGDGPSYSARQRLR